MNVVTRLPGMVVTDHEVAVPLDHDRPDGEQIRVFAREVVAPRREGDDLPWLVFFQGGPGSGAPRPPGADFVGRLIEDYRVLLLDQRGTGRSTPATRQTLAGLDPAAQTAYLRHFRADGIVRDAELLRHQLVRREQPWSVLGQSYGGFCAVTYLSLAPEGLREVLVTGGLPPLGGTADDVYRATYQRVLDRNARFYARYPGDVDRARRVAEFLRANDVRLPSGDPLPVARFQQLGMAFGMTDGFERLHYLLEDAFVDGGGSGGSSGGSELSDAFLYAVEAEVSMASNPLYAVLHEAAYCQGTASRWSAQRLRAEHPELDAADGPVLFTGEMIYPWLFEADAALRPLADAAHALADVTDWPHLYDRQRLAANEVPVAAAVYYDDMYVERAFSEETARAINGARVWVTNEFEHDGLRLHGRVVLDRLLEMVAGDR